MKFEIETYKGQSIEYDDDADKFVCDISIEDKNKSTKRMSLADVRKEIDTFIKVNADFKPFKTLLMDKYDKKSFDIGEVTAIRTDGKFIVKTRGYNSHYGAKSMQYAMVYDNDVVKEKERLNEVFEEARKTYVTSVAELCKKLVPVDLSKYEHIINPAE
jgi:hypothetical protein